MRIWILISLLSGIGAVQECDLSDRKPDLPFPDIESEAIESYQMSVEYSVPGVNQTDFYTEYYDILDRRGRVDSHQAGKSFTYVYRTASWEAWEITKGTCKLQNITDVPYLYKDDQTDWTYMPADKPDRRTVGPSAMFKIALDVWNNGHKYRSNYMAYMGDSAKVRGLKAHRWRRCSSDGSYVDYFFSAYHNWDTFGPSNMKWLPLRVFFGGIRKGYFAELSVQQYDILTFQPYISLDARPFQLPVGIGCRRVAVEDAPKIPDFKGKSLQFHAEVVYRTTNKDGEETQYWSYYSKLYLALDLASKHLAYHYTPWSKTAKYRDADAPVRVIYDAKNGYLYKTPLDTGKCEISRVKNFYPELQLPNDGGSIALTDPSILYPNSELTYISEGINRGLRVNFFEAVVRDYRLKQNGRFKKIPKVVVTHSYLQDDQIVRDTVSVKNSLVQVQLRFIGRKNMIEILTFNFFGFTTELRNEMSIFNIKRCLKNVNDYAWVTLGFNAEQVKLQRAFNSLPSIKSNILKAVSLRTELNAVRIPYIGVDVKDGIRVSLMILGRPPVQLDYLDAEEGQTVAYPGGEEGVSDFETCGKRCLETENNCWGFSMCGAVCYFGTKKSNKTASKNGCKLYKRFDLESYIHSKESLVENLRAQVKKHEGFSLMLKDKDDKMIQIDVSSFEVTYPGDKIFARIGDTLSPRMRVVKVGYKLADAASTPINNMGKLRYDECQRLCLDFKDCETASYCLRDSECLFTSTYGDDLKKEHIIEDNMCNLITRKYADHFDRSPGLTLPSTPKEVLDLDTLEKCANACLTQTKFKCLSFDRCPGDWRTRCNLYDVHFPIAANTSEKRSPYCGHYSRRYSSDFQKSHEKRMVGSNLPPLSNLTLEECSKSCMEHGKGTCIGFDFCQGDTILATSCNLLDSGDTWQMKYTYSPTCTNYLRTEVQFLRRPYSYSFTGGIGFFCFLIGVLLGAAVVFRHRVHESQQTIKTFKLSKSYYARTSAINKSEKKIKETFFVNKS